MKDPVLTTIETGLLAAREKIIATFPDPTQAVLIGQQRLVENIEPEINTVPTHTRIVFDHKTFPRIVDWVVSTAREGRYEALAACGHSGLTVVGAAAYVLNIPVIAVRKSDEGAHDCRQLNAILPKADVNYAFVDDLIASGDTFIRVVEKVYRNVSVEARCRGILLYNSLGDVDKTLTELGIRRKSDRHIIQACRAPVHERPRTKSNFSD